MRDSTLLAAILGVSRASQFDLLDVLEASPYQFTKALEYVCCLLNQSSTSEANVRQIAGCCRRTKPANGSEVRKYDGIGAPLTAC